MGVDHHGSAQPFGQCQFIVGHIHGRHIEAHRLRVLHRHVAQAADAGDHHPVTRFGVGHLQALVDRDAGAKHGRDIHRADVGRQMAHIVGIGHYILGKSCH